jgi:hypothetical protein
MFLKLDLSNKESYIYNQLKEDCMKFSKQNLYNLFSFAWFSSLLLFAISGNCIKQCQATKEVFEGRVSAKLLPDSVILSLLARREQ